MKVSDTLAETAFLLFKPKYLSDVTIHIGLIRDNAVTPPDFSLLHLS